MKKIYLNIVSIVLCMTMITGCDNEENIPTSDLQILASEINMDATGGKRVCRNQFIKNDQCPTDRYRLV